MAVAALIASTALSAAGQYKQGQAQAAAGEYNAGVADRNAAVSRGQAAMQAALQQKSSARKIGAARAAYGAAGVTSDGSPLDVLEASASAAELDRQTILYRGELAAMGYSDTATLDRMNADNAESSGKIGAVGQLLGGAGKYYGRYGSPSYSF